MRASCIRLFSRFVILVTALGVAGLSPTGAAAVEAPGAAFLTVGNEARAVPPTMAQARRMRHAGASGPLRLLGRLDGARVYEFPVLDVYVCLATGTPTTFFGPDTCMGQLPACGDGSVALHPTPDGALSALVCFAGSAATPRVLETWRGPTWAQKERQLQRPRAHSQGAG